MFRFRRKSALFVLFAAALTAGQGARAASPIRALLQENRLDEGKKICRQFEELSSYESDSLLACAWVYYRLDMPESAERLMDKIRKGSGNGEAQLLGVFGQMKRKQFEAARRTLNQLVADYKGGPLGLTAQELSAELYELTDQFDTAAFIYKQIVGENPKRGRAQWGLGRYYLARNDPGRAKRHLEQTTVLWPRHLGSRFNLAVLALQNNQLNDAAHWLAECYKINRSDVGVLEQLGTLFEKKGEINKAIQFWQRAAEIHPESSLAKEKLNLYVTQVIDALIESKQYEKALAQMNSFGKNLMKDPKMLVRRGAIYRNLRKYDKAIKDLLVYTAKQPNDGMGLRELGICYLNIKLMDQAGANFAKAIVAEPGNGQNYAWLGFFLEAKGKPSEALEAWKKAIENLQDPEELSRATRRVAHLEKKLGKSSSTDREKTKEREKEEPREEATKPSEDGPQIPLN